MSKSILSLALIFNFALAFAMNPQPETFNTPSKADAVFNVNSFCQLIQSGDYETVKTLIEKGEDVNQKSMGLTPLMFAARHNRPEIAQLLINNGAKLKTRSDRDNLTALEWAERSKATDSFDVIEKAMKEEKEKKKRKKNK